ncbi:unnamed protein product [Alopecurus aequalis]
MKTAQTLLLTLAFLVLASETMVEASRSRVLGEEICAGAIEPTPVPCDRPSCLHVCRQALYGCPKCTWTAECTHRGCECNVCQITHKIGDKLSTRLQR